MNTDALCSAVWGAREWLEHFNRREYEKYFKLYMDRYGEVYAQAVRDADGDETKLRALAESILDGIEAGWKRQRIWNRASVRVEEKQVIVDYLSPMLMELPDPKCGRLAGMLRQVWAERWPKDAYQMTTYEVLKGGFRNSILGIDLSGKHINPDKDR